MARKRNRSSLPKSRRRNVPPRCSSLRESRTRSHSGVPSLRNRSLQRRKQHLYKVRFTVNIALAAAFALLAVAFKFSRLEQHQAKIQTLTQAMLRLRTAAKLDSMRRFHTQKVLRLIEEHNPGMAAQQKFAIADAVHEMTNKYPNLNVELICATITHESARTWRPRIKSHAGALGLMQIMPATAALMAREEAMSWTSSEEILYDPVSNIRLGCRYLSKLISQYGLEGGLAAYNGGEKRAVLWLTNGKVDNWLHEETRTYVPTVLKLYSEYRRP